MSHAPTRLPAQAHAVHFEPAHALVPLGRVAATARDAAPRPPRAPARVRSVAPRPLAERHLRQPQAGAPLAISPWVVRIHATHRPCVCGARAVHTRAQAHVACACTWWHAARGTSMCTYALLPPGCRWASGSTRGCTTATASKSSTASSCGTARQAPRPPPPTHHPHSWPAGPVHPLPEHPTLTTGPHDPRLLLQGRGRAGRCRPVTSTAVHIEHKRAQGSQALLAARRADAELCRGYAPAHASKRHARHVYGGAPGRSRLTGNV